MTVLKFENRPYRLLNKIQHYAWGTRNEEAFIPRLLKIEVEKDKPYAELWMGTHPNAPSEVEVNGRKVLLAQIIKTFPEEILGHLVIERFGAQLPFLFKVLSAGEALSIQAHPNKKQAEILHQKDPEHYPDDNHKPEIAIALDQLTALVGFRSLTEIEQVLMEFPEIIRLSQSFGSSGENFKLESSSFRNFVSELMKTANNQPDQLEITLQSMEEKIRQRSQLSERDRLFLELREKYGTDVGLIYIYLLNLLHLKKGQGVFLKAGVPHAYLKGNIVECMANSDNVVRAGLTPKFKDIETLIDILTFETGPVEIMDGSVAGEFEYRVPIQEFSIKHFAIAEGERTELPLKSVAIMIVTQGEGKVLFEDGKVTVKQGESYLLPASLREVRFEALTNFEVFCAFVPCDS